MAYFFELPKLDELTYDQRMALDEIEPIAISGGAGTGKTVISLLRHLKIMEANNNYSLLVTYTKTLGFYLQMSLHSMEDKEKYRSGIIPPSQQVFIIKDFPFTQNWKVYEIIIDEAQDLTFNKLQEIQSYAKNLSYGADFNQKLYGGTVTENEIKTLFLKNEEYNLQQNFRNTYAILNFVKAVLVNFYIPQSTLDELKEKSSGFKPIMFISTNFDKEIENIIELINEFKSDSHNIAILLPFGDDRYDGNQSVDKYFFALQNKGLLCSRYYNEMHTNNIQIENLHITTFKSSKGLEFDTVVIPQLNKFQNNIKNAYTVNEEDYYVAFTRAKRNLYLTSSKELNFIDKNSYDIEILNNSYQKIPEISISDDEIPF
jgi:superfamily I DNA/RNA helicase